MTTALKWTNNICSKKRKLSEKLSKDISPQDLFAIVRLADQSKCSFGVVLLRPTTSKTYIGFYHRVSRRTNQLIAWRTKQGDYWTANDLHESCFLATGKLQNGLLSNDMLLMFAISLSLDVAKIEAALRSMYPDLITEQQLLDFVTRMEVVSSLIDMYTSLRTKTRNS